MSLTDLTAAELLATLSAGRATSVEVTQAFVDRIKRLDTAVGAFLRVDAAAALEQAAAIDARRKRREPLGPLAGVPVAVKDLVCAKGELTTCASRMLANFRSPFDATVIERLRAADAVLLGRTNMDEFAMGGSTENSAFQPTRNPWDLRCAPGGSSGGAAACVAAAMVPLSIGSDTGGSIRQPAALCGITGLKPTYGRVSRWGLVAFASSLDQIGPLAWTAEDAALLLGAIAGHDARDSTSVDTESPDYTAALGEPLKGLRLGIAREHFAEGLDDEVNRAVREAINVFRSLGATVKEVSLPHSGYGIAAYYLIASSEASSNLARYDGMHYGHRAGVPSDASESGLAALYRRSRGEGFGPEVKRRIMLGTYALSAGYYDAYYLRAQRVRRLIRNDFDQAFEEVDLIVGPTTASPAFELGAKVDDPLAMYLVDLYTVPANLAGIAGISIPCGLSREGLPIGMQLQAAPFAEAKLLNAAHQFQEFTDWHTKRPKL